MVWLVVCLWSAGRASATGDAPVAAATHDTVAAARHPAHRLGRTAAEITSKNVTRLGEQPPRLAVYVLPPDAVVDDGAALELDAVLEQLHDLAVVVELKTARERRATGGRDEALDVD